MVRRTYQGVNPVTVILSAGTPKERKWVALGGMCGPMRVGLHKNSVINVERGLLERVFFVPGPDGSLVRPPQAIAGVFEDRMSEFRQLLVAKMGRLLPYTQDEFLATYKGARRATMEKAFETLLHTEVRPDDAYINTFVKAEKLALWKKADPAPRVIQPRTARYNAVVGPFIKAAEHPIYRGIGKLFGEKYVVMKGLNAAKSASVAKAKWDKYDRPVGVGLDASRFDQHVGAQALRWEHSVYVGAYGPRYREKLSKLLAWQIDNRGVAYLPEGRVKYRVNGNRMSGDMNTSLGNCILMCAMIYAYAKVRGVQVSLMNNGDDCMVIMESTDLAAFSTGLDEWFVEMGFTMKVEDPIYEFEHLEFCQTKPVWNGEQYVMCRSPFAGLTKDSVCLRPDMGVKRVEAFTRWAQGVGKCGVAAAAGLPVMQAAYCYMQSGKHGLKSKDAGLGEYSGLGWMSMGMDAAARDVTTDARVSFYRAWGLDPDEQILLETAMQSERFPECMTTEVSCLDNRNHTLLDETRR